MKDSLVLISFEQSGNPMGIISSDIQRAVRLLSQGDLVAIPTETVYGLAANIYNEAAVHKIFSLKQRPLYNPLIVHTHSINQLSQFVIQIPEPAHKLAEAFWPGPLTLILKKQSSIPNLVSAGKDTIGIRIPNHPVTLELLRQLPFPLAAPSANPFGQISPTTPKHVAGYFKENLKMVLDGGACQRGIESTIVGFENGRVLLYRLGSIAMEEIESVIGSVQLMNQKEQAPDAPGMLSRHYAPNTPTYLVDDVMAFLKNRIEKRIGVLSFSKQINAPNIMYQKVLSKEGYLKEAASKLYAAMHTMDEMELDLIVAERFPDSGLGKTINDRLSRATQGKNKDS